MYYRSLKSAVVRCCYSELGPFFALCSSLLPAFTSIHASSYSSPTKKVSVKPEPRSPSYTAAQRTSRFDNSIGCTFFPLYAFDNVKMRNCPWSTIQLLTIITCSRSRIENNCISHVHVKLLCGPCLTSFSCSSIFCRSLECYPQLESLGLQPLVWRHSRFVSREWRSFKKLTKVRTCSAGDTLLCCVVSLCMCARPHLQQIQLSLSFTLNLELLATSVFKKWAVL